MWPRLPGDCINRQEGGHNRGSSRHSRRSVTGSHASCWCGSDTGPDTNPGWLRPFGWCVSTDRFEPAWMSVNCTSSNARGVWSVGHWFVCAPACMWWHQWQEGGHKESSSRHSRSVRGQHARCCCGSGPGMSQAFELCASTLEAVPLPNMVLP
jgi:hypothetical protein